MAKVLEWMDWYHELEEYYKEYGNIDVPIKYETKEGLKLGKWLTNQRQAYKEKGTNKITKDQIQLLDSLKMNWDMNIAVWNKNYNALKEYYEEYGNVDVPGKYVTKDGLKLGQWVFVQRKAYKEKGKSKITEDQIQLLNDLGMKWKIEKRTLNKKETLNKKVTCNKKETWDKYYQALVKYYEEHGNVDVSIKYETKEGLKLGKWLTNQRQAYKGKGTHKITKDQIQLLDNLKMNWDMNIAVWNKNYNALKEYYEEYGNVDVPGKYVTKDGLKLGQWVFVQRKAYKGKGKSKITEDQIHLLNNLNIDWSVPDTKLLKMKIVKENKDKYYSVLNDRLSHVLTDISYEVGNEITKENQKELCKQIVKKVWR